MTKDEPSIDSVVMPGALAEMIEPPRSHAADAATVDTPAAGLAAVIAIGCVALLMLGVQPVVLGALQSAGRLTIPAMGQAATIETLALGAVSAGMAARVRHRRLRLWSLLGVVLIIAANGAGLVANGLGFVLSRGLAGVAGGIIVWVATGVITRRHDAGRVNAIFLGAQALSQGATAALIPVTIGPTLGADSGLWVIGGLAVLGLLLLPLIPRQLPDPPAEAKARGRLNLSSLAALASLVLMLAGIVGLWVYVEPIAAAERIPADTVAFAVAASLAAQVAGAVIFVAIEKRLRPAAGLLGVAAALLAVTASFAWLPGLAPFFAAILVFGVLWTFAMALGLPLLIAADPTRRAALYGPAAILLGASLGPLLAGAMASDTNISPALGVAAALTAGAAAFVIASAVSRGRGS